ncbi:MAG TPA: hypothetical protein PLE25_05945 [Spirochaetales bacterium]|nr:hypothetical protein [Spirochaetales bacterium]
MTQFMATLSTAQAWLLAAGALVLVVVLVALAMELRFRRAVRLAATRRAAGGARVGAFMLAVRERYILRRARRGFARAPGPFPELPAALGCVERWRGTLASTASGRAASRLLEFSPETALFDCFEAALRKGGSRSSGAGKALASWMADQGEGFALRRVALSGPGRDFDAAAAGAFLADRMDEVRELLGDPEWAARAMAVRILALDDAERSKKGIADSLADPHPLVRRLALQAPLAGERLAFYEEAYRIFTKDPALEVRRAAKARIMAEFPDLYAPDMDALGPEEQIHVLELLDSASERDEEIAFRFLESGESEQRLAAAEHLEARGSLRPLLEQANPGDAKDFERRLSLLRNAAEFQVYGFLEAVATMETDGAFLAAARVLESGGDRAYLAPLAARWFERMGSPPYPADKTAVYRAVLDAVKARGDRAACEAVARELEARRGDRELAAAVLGATDGSQDRVIFDTLCRLFADPLFPLRDELREALLKQPPELVVPFTLGFLRADRSGTPRALRRDALILAGQLKLAWAIQRTMETLPTLDLEEIGALAPIVVDADSKAFKRKARYILDGVDAPSRASVLAALQAAGDRSFMADIKAALADADPDVRSAAVRALAAFNEDKTLGSGGIELLRDPVERVRVAAAAAIAEAGGPGAVKKLAAVLADQNEVDEVKLSLVRGLGRATDAASLELLIDALGAKDGRSDELVEALSRRRSRKDLGRILERFKDATGELKARIAEAVRRMGKPGEEALVDLLAEDIVSLKPFIVEALESLGYVERRIRELKHRDPALRRAAAAALSVVGSRAAYRGIVLAARDPDGEVRVAVTRALERLAGPEGEALLAELQNDPDARVRKYVLWAMERVRAKAL